MITDIHFLQNQFTLTNAFLKNVKDYYNGKDVPDEFSHLFGEQMSTALEKFSTMTDEQIQALLTYDIIDEHPNDNQDETGLPIMGKNLDLFNPDNNKERVSANGINYVYYDEYENVRTSSFGIDDDVLWDFESALFGLGFANIYGVEVEIGGPGLKGSDAELAINAFIGTLFHEFVHYGRNLNMSGEEGNPSTGPEWGESFEKEAYGEDFRRRIQAVFPDDFDPDTGTFWPKP